MLENSASEADLCANCVEFVHAIASRSKFFQVKALSKQVGNEGLWPPSPGCVLCQNIISCCSNLTQDPHGADPNFGPNSIKILFSPKAGEESPTSKLRVTSIKGINLHFAVWTDNGSSQICSDPPLPSDNCPESFSLINGWIRSCRENHEECYQGLSKAKIDEINGPFLPSRVLDIGNLDQGYLTLVESKQQRANYCSLSYCWGQAKQSLLTTRATLANHLSGLPFDTLPQTFKDAVRITSEIGIRYLWIDALCIIQDDKDDWAKEAGRMADVYLNAYLVIAAGGASCPQDGCFVRREVFPMATKVSYSQIQGHPETSIWLAAQILKVDEDHPSGCSLQQRGWALQESYLARRVVHFVSAGMFWKCQMEEMEERSVTDLEMWDERWANILEAYSKRDHTYLTDRLPAILGLARAYEDKTGDRYSTGVFESILTECLLWTMIEYTLASQKLPDIPSWSWAQRGGGKIFWKSSGLFEVEGDEVRGNLKLVSSAVIEFTGNLEDCKISPAKDTLTLHDGLMGSPYIRALVWILGFYATRKDDLNLISSVPDTSQCIGVASMDEPYSGAAFAAVAAEMAPEAIVHEVINGDCELNSSILSKNSPFRFYWVLLLIPVEDRQDTYQRIGMGAVLIDPKKASATGNAISII